jgi:hypothetical protein
MKLKKPDRKKVGTYLYPISYPSTKTSVVSGAYDEQCAACMRTTVSVEHVQLRGVFVLKAVTL